MVAKVGSELCQVPPVVGFSEVVAPTQIVLGPTMLATGLAFTVTPEVGTDVQPVLALVNTKLAVPGATPWTIPLEFTVATEELLLTQIPPVEGSKLVTCPKQI